jgi:hypothetical protein
MGLTLSEVRIPLSGAALALVSGLLLGGAMQPHLYDGDRPSGPQMFADWAGARSTGPFDPGTTFASYSGKIPDYVLGTDWKRRMDWPPEPAATPAPRDPSAGDPSADEPVVLTRAAFEAPTAPEYPSMEGPHPSVIAVTPEDEPTPDPAVGA